MSGIGFRPRAAAVYCLTPFLPPLNCNKHRKPGGKNQDGPALTPRRRPGKLGRLSEILRDRFYFDELYAFLNRWTQESLARVADWFDRWIIAGAGVRGISGTVDITATMLRLCQSGNLRNYALLLAIGLLLMLGFFLF